MKILYGVCGEGNGHATRSKVVIDYLKKKHEVKIIAGRCAYTFLKKYYDTEEISSFFIKYSNNKVNNLGTVILNAIHAVKYMKTLLKVLKIIDEFAPDLIITDWEPFAMYAGIIKKKIIFSIDNAQIMCKTKINIPKGKLLSYLKARIIMKALTPKANHYFITSFFPPENIDESATIIPPILREEVIKQKCTKKDFYFVYQTSKSNEKLLATLKEFPQKFIIYGFDIEKNEGNLFFKKNNQKEFFKELASCKGVITNGGFSLITEALYLGKPILALPVKGQFEQEMNAHYLEKMNLGMYANATEKKVINKFIEYSKKFKSNIKIEFAGEKIFKQIESKIEEIMEK